MSREIREDPTTGRRVIFAPERLRRPRAEVLGLPDVSAADCPFCPGHEASTAPTIARWPARGAWRARAFANRFPALLVEQDPAGAHEVIVETADHDGPIWEDVEGLAGALRLARDRMRDLSGDRRFASMAWFRNHGIRAGASQPHPHAQLIALPYVPAALGALLARGRTADVVDSARTGGRVVLERGGAVALCPWAPAFPFETWLFPTTPADDFRTVTDDEIADLAAVMAHSLTGIARELAPAATVAALFTRPLLAAQSPAFCWHIRIQPRAEIESGFAAATGDAINGVLPEVAATLLRAPSPEQQQR